MSIQLGLESHDFRWNTWRAVAAEFIATGVFLFVGPASVVAANALLNDQIAQGLGQPTTIPGVGFIIAVALAHGLAIALLVAAVAKISGGHINPAVTFAAVTTGKMKVSTGVLYVAAQMGAACLGVVLLKSVIAEPFENNLGALTLNTAILQENVGDGALSGLIVEGALTFVLVFVIFAAAMDPRGMANLAPIAIGLAVLVDHLVGIPLTGAGMNPARWFGPAAVGNFWDDWWIYVLGPLIGAAIAALVYELIFMQREPDEEEPALTAPAPPISEQPVSPESPASS
jgi:aquaporin TIP